MVCALHRVTVSTSNNCTRFRVQRHWKEFCTEYLPVARYPWMLGVDHHAPHLSGLITRFPNPQSHSATAARCSCQSAVFLPFAKLAAQISTSTTTTTTKPSFRVHFPRSVGVSPSSSTHRHGHQHATPPLVADCHRLQSALHLIRWHSTCPGMI